MTRTGSSKIVLAKFLGLRYTFVAMLPTKDSNLLPSGLQPHGGLYVPRRGLGRPKGTRGEHKKTKEARQFASSIIDDPIYRANLLARAQTGTLAPGIEQMLWHYAKGKPKDTVDVNMMGSSEFTDLSTQEIAARIAMAAARAAEIAEMSQDADYQESEEDPIETH